MKKQEAINIILDCAKLYQKNLLGNNLLFIFRNSNNIEYFEAVFEAKHFLHLTGIRLEKNNGSANFFRNIISNRLNPSDFRFASDGTTELKLQVLTNLMNIHCRANMVGEYASIKYELFTEKLAGNVTACLGFVRDSKNYNYYVPNTALKEDIRDISKKPQQRILAILRKPIKQPTYAEICYTAKGISFSEIKFKEKENLVAPELLAPVSKPDLATELIDEQSIDLDEELDDSLGDDDEI